MKKRKSYRKGYGDKWVMLTEEEYEEFLKRFNPRLIKFERRIQKRLMKCPMCENAGTDCKGCTFHKFATPHCAGCYEVSKRILGGTFHLGLNNPNFVYWDDDAKARKEFRLLTEELKKFKKIDY